MPEGQQVYRAPKGEEHHKFYCRLPVALYDRLRERGQRNRRAIAAEIILMIEAHFAAEDAASAQANGQHAQGAA